jgi:hypothetical protein
MTTSREAFERFFGGHGLSMDLKRDNYAVYEVALLWEGWQARDAEVDALKADAERYRWQLDNPGPWWSWAVQQTGRKNLNAAIDAQRSK